MYRYFCTSLSSRFPLVRGRHSLFSLNSKSIVPARGKYSDVIRFRRAIMYVPGHDMRKVDKIRTTNVDCAVLDCEDGVALNMKDEARKIINEIPENYDFGSSEYAVRINSIDSSFAEEDFVAVLSGRKLPETLMIPKIESVEHIKWIENALDSKKIHLNAELNLILFIESAKSLINLKNICEAALKLSQKKPIKFEGLVFGSDDFCADIGATRTTNAQELLTARQWFVIVSKAYKLQAIDMVHINYKDLLGLEKVAQDGASMGFTGKQVIHPSQVAIVQKAFSPSLEKIEWARELIKQFKLHQIEGKGAFTFRGAMIDKPLLLQAEHILKLAEKL